MASNSVECKKNDGCLPSSGILSVLFLASEWGSSKGGLSTINRELAINIAKHPQVDVTFYVPRCNDEDKKAARLENINLVSAKRVPGMDELHWLSFPPENLKIDVVVGHGVKLGPYACSIRDLRKCKWVQVVHTVPEELGMHKMYANAISVAEKKHQTEVELCQLADFVVSVGSKLNEAFRCYLSSCQQNEMFFNFTPGIFSEFSNVKHAYNTTRRFRVLLFGRGDAEDFEVKGFDIAAKAVAVLSDVYLIFVGVPEGEHEKVKGRFLNCGIHENKLTIRSYVKDRESLKRQFCEVDLAIMPSRTEGFGLTGLEALSAGLPVLVSGNSGFGEALSKVLFGSYFVVHSDDHQIWANAIKGLQDKDRNDRLKECEALRSSYANKYSWEEQSEELVSRMIGVVEGSSAQRQSVTHQEAFQQTEISSERYPGAVKVLIEVESATFKKEASGDLKGLMKEMAKEFIDTMADKIPAESIPVGLFCYLEGVRQLKVKGAVEGSLRITVECPTLEILEGLWEDYCSGHLNAVAEEYLLTDDIKRRFHVESVRLKTKISEEDYLVCKHFLKGSFTQCQKLTCQEALQQTVDTSEFHPAAELNSRTMDSSSKFPPVEAGVQGGMKRKKETQAALCTPFCEENCEFQGQHNDMIMSLVNLHESDGESLDAWKECVISLSCDLNEPLEDPNPNFRYPLLHWAAMLGMVKAVQCLLTEVRVSLRKGNSQGISNEAVIFSMVRYLHEGVKCKDPNQVSKIFVKILDSLLKRDANLLLVREVSNSNTVLHLCAQGEEGSTAPFLMYLRRALVKLKEISYSSESLPLNWLKNILEQRNEQGDTFIDVGAKFNNQKEAWKLIDLIKDKFVLSVRKAEEILNKRKVDDRENVHDDDENGDGDEDYDGTNDGKNKAVDKEEELKVKNTFEPGHSAVYDPDQAPPAKIRNTADESSTFSKDPLPHGVSLPSVSSHLQHWDDDRGSKVILSTAKPLVKERVNVLQDYTQAADETQSESVKECEPMTLHFSVNGKGQLANIQQRSVLETNGELVTFPEELTNKEDAGRSVKEFPAYLQRVKLIQDSGQTEESDNSLQVAVECENPEILEQLWRDYCSGYLNVVAEKCLLTDNIKSRFHLTTVKLKTTILEEDYLACKDFLLNNQESNQREAERQVLSPPIYQEADETRILCVEENAQTQSEQECSIQGVDDLIQCSERETTTQTLQNAQVYVTDDAENRTQIVDETLRKYVTNDDVEQTQNQSTDGQRNQVIGETQSQSTKEQNSPDAGIVQNQSAERQRNRSFLDAQGQYAQRQRSQGIKENHNESLEEVTLKVLKETYSRSSKEISPWFPYVSETIDQSADKPVYTESIFKDHKGERKVCQGKLCSSSIETGKEVAVKVCHHEDCQEINNGNPLLLCLKCDEVYHLGAASNHTRFDVPERPSTNLFRMTSASSDSGNEDDLESEPNNKVDKKHRGYSSRRRMFKSNSAAKKKPRRHNTDDPGRDFFSIKFFDHKSGEFHINLVRALSGKSLRDSIEPLFESQNFSFTTHSVFLDSSNTPLPVAFDTFPLGGNVLHVRANADMNVDQRIIDMVSVEEGMRRPKSSSFLHRSGSFTTKGSKDKGGTLKKAENDDKDRESGKEEKSLQQFNKNIQRGRKSMVALFGKEFGGMQPQPSSPVLHGGMYTGGSGSMSRPRSAGRIQRLFNQPKSMKGTLKDALDRYSLYGLEENSSYACNFKSQIEDIVKLETSWTEVVNEAHIKAMTKKQKDQQEAIWELLSTEAAYIAKLHVIIKLFVQCLRKLQREGFLTEIEGSKLFSNVEEIYTVNLAFWMADLSRVVENARQTKDPLNPLDMEQGFNMFESHFDPYIQYCMEEANCLKYFKEKLMESEEFRTYISWCEDHPYCPDWLKLNDFLVKPMQRVAKYPLLVRRIYNKTLEIEVKEHLTKMRDQVESFVSKVNGAMRVRHELEKLKATAEGIRNDYNVVEAVNDEMDKILQEYSSYDLMRPMPGLTEDEHRCVIHEGPLRLLEKQGKMDVYVFLFTDLLLITKARKGGDRFKVIKPPLEVDKLSLRASKDQGTFLLIYVNEYNIAVQAFALQGTVSDQSQWMEAIKKAQKLFMIAKLGQGSTNMLQMQTSSDNDLASPSGLVTPGLSSSPAFPHAEHRRSSASSIMSLESDSDDESSVALPTRLRSDSALSSMTTISSTSFAMDARIRDAQVAAPNAATSESSPSNSLERAGKAGKIGKRSSESARCPVKPDKSHYPMSASLDLADWYAKSDSRKDKGYAPPPGSLSVSRKKSMSLSDLLNIGKDLTSSRWKDKESDKDKNQPKILEPLSPLSLSTDEETVSHTDGKKEEKKSRFSRLRRKSSRAELKDGIASGPNIDPKRASRHFFKESLMWEFS